VVHRHTGDLRALRKVGERRHRFPMRGQDAQLLPAVEIEDPNRAVAAAARDLAPIGRDHGGGERRLVTPEGRDQPPALDLVDAEDAVGVPGDDKTPVPGVDETGDPRGLADEPPLRLALTELSQLPKLQSGVETPGGERQAVGGEREPADRRVVAGAPQDFLTGVQAPQMDVPVHVAGSEKGSVG